MNSGHNEPILVHFSSSLYPDTTVVLFNVVTVFEQELF